MHCKPLFRSLSVAAVLALAGLGSNEACPRACNFGAIAIAGNAETAGICCTRVDARDRSPQRTNNGRAGAPTSPARLP